VSALLGAAFATLSAVALGQTTTVPDPSTQVPAAWVGRKPGMDRFSGMVELRGIYHWVDGAGPPRRDWTGGELLSYFDVHEGLSGAFVLRQEMRDEVADYGTVMLIPRVADDVYVVSSLGAGNGAPFMPLTRLDVQVRAFVPGWKQGMIDVGGYSTWWTQNRRQLAQSSALILWYSPLIVEMRFNSIATRADTLEWRFNPQGSIVVLYGTQGEQWLLFRTQLGTEPENVPGRAFRDTRDLFVMNFTAGFRYWVEKEYGFNVELEMFHQVFTWSRVGSTVGMFVSF
jgi:hypothetical protein